MSNLKSLFLWNLREDIWEHSLEYPEKDITSDRNQKEAFCETALCRVNSTRTVKLLFSLSSILTLFLFSLRRDIRQCVDGYDEKGHILRQKLERSFL